MKQVIKDLFFDWDSIEEPFRLIMTIFAFASFCYGHAAYALLIIFTAILFSMPLNKDDD